MNTLQGIIPALLTPFDSQGNVHTETLKRLVNFQIDNGVTGFFVNGGTGEGLLMNLDERRLVLETTLEAAAGRVPVIAHIGAMSTRDAVELTRHAAEVGAAAVSSIPPIYFRVDFEAMKAHYQSIAEAAGDVPMWIYYIPQATGVTLTPQMFMELLEIEQIVGVKFTSYNFFEMRNLIEMAQPRELSVLSGPDEMCFPALTMGAVGAIGTTYNLLPAHFVKLYNAFCRGDLAEAQRLQYEGNRIIRVLLSVSIIAAIKELLTMAGFDCGEPRRPQRPLTDAEREKLLTDLQSTTFADLIGMPYQ
ncbi:MAG: dihydrodipicolinate synthase family protein [Anaerolineae bacterium]|nr:dihydrodipicolinate synthase family protein [Anaerolineae bacterium]